MFKSNLGYSAINTARSALSTMITDVNNAPFGQHVLVKRFMNGFYELRPALLKHSKTGNIQTVLEYLSTMGSSSTISLKLLTLRLGWTALSDYICFRYRLWMLQITSIFL